MEFVSMREFTASPKETQKRLLANKEMVVTNNGTPTILAEYEQVLCRSKFAEVIHTPAIRRFFDLMNEIGSNIVSTPSKIKLPDEMDRKFYDVAKTAGAVLVTGNKKHYTDKPSIISPSQFLSPFED
ncbi:MAG: hypothetical protein FWE59_00305 [Oscillospiraceae bacterium]|nr:hypothetical protein [Oscillospiraceae bacterium]